MSRPELATCLNTWAVHPIQGTHVYRDRDLPAFQVHHCSISPTPDSTYEGPYITPWPIERSSPLGRGFRSPQTGGRTSSFDLRPQKTLQLKRASSVMLVSSVCCPLYLSQSSHKPTRPRHDRLVHLARVLRLSRRGNQDRSCWLLCWNEPCWQPFAAHAVSGKQGPMDCCPSRSWPCGRQHATADWKHQLDG